MKLKWFSKQLYLFLLVFMGLGWLSKDLVMYFFMDMSVWDTGLQAHPVANFARNGQYYNHFLDLIPFANHFRPALLVFYPLMVLAPTVLWLTTAKVFAYLWSSWLLKRFAENLSLPKAWIYTIPIFWLIHDVLMTAMAVQNQATALALPFIILVFYYAWQEKWVPMVLNLGLLLLFKENMALIGLCAGLFLAVEKQEYKKGAMVFVGGLLAGLITYLWVMPVLSQGTMISNGEFAPFRYLGLKSVMLVKMLLAFGFLPLFYPRCLLYIFPSFGLYLVGDKLNAFWVSGHYHDYTTTVMFIGLLFTLRAYLTGQINISIIKPRTQRTLLTVFMALFVVSGLTKLPHYTLFKFNQKERHDRFSIQRAVTGAKNQLGKEGMLWVPDNLGCYFIEFSNIKVWDEHWIPQQVVSWKRPYTIVLPKQTEYSSNTAHQIKYLMGLVERDPSIKKQSMGQHLYIISAEAI